ncbi:hypothetical protein ACLOJK_028448 [Asimina triloba]
MAEAGDDGLLVGERVLVADGGEQLVDGLEEDSRVGGFRLDGAIGGDEGGDAAIENHGAGKRRSELGERSELESQRETVSQRGRGRDRYGKDDV